MNPSIGNINASERNEISKEWGVDFDYRTWEGFNAKLALPKGNNNIKCFFLLPSSFLHRQVKDYKSIRQKLINDNAIKTIIRFPKNFFSPDTSISFCLVDVDYSQKHESVQFINGFEITPNLSPKNKKGTKTFLEEISIYWQEGGVFIRMLKTLRLMKLNKIIIR